jgi:hypothetical protein
VAMAIWWIWDPWLNNKRDGERRPLIPIFDYFE